MLLPFKKGALPTITFFADVDFDCAIEAQLRVAEKPGNFTPDVTLEKLTIPIAAGKSVPVDLKFCSRLDQDQYAFVCLMKVTRRAEGNEISEPRLTSREATLDKAGSAAPTNVKLLTSDTRVSGVLALVHDGNDKVSLGATQIPPDDIGIDTFEFWLPERRPGGKNLALKLSDPITLFSAAEVATVSQRPVLKPNLWVASLDDREPRLTLKWSAPVLARSIILCFDTDFDHPMESVQLGHPEREIPFCVKDYDLLDESGNVLYTKRDNHQTRNVIIFEEVLRVGSLTIKILATHGAPAAIFRVMVFE
jgi:hypothetical protein